MVSVYQRCGNDDDNNSITWWQKRRWMIWFQYQCGDVDNDDETNIEFRTGDHSQARNSGRGLLSVIRRRKPSFAQSPSPCFIVQRRIHRYTWSSTTYLLLYTTILRWVAERQSIVCFLFFPAGVQTHNPCLLAALLRLTESGHLAIFILVLDRFGVWSKTLSIVF